MSKSVGLASTEYMFSYLFTFRFNKFMRDLNSLESDNAITNTKLTDELYKHVGIEKQHKTKPGRML
jgi:hypothetical protein